MHWSVLRFWIIWLFRPVDRKHLKNYFKCLFCWIVSICVLILIFISTYFCLYSPNLTVLFLSVFWTFLQKGLCIICLLLFNILFRDWPIYRYFYQYLSILPLSNIGFVISDKKKKKSTPTKSSKNFELGFKILLWKIMHIWFQKTYNTFFFKGLPA